MLDKTREAEHEATMKAWIFSIPCCHMNKLAAAAAIWYLQTTCSEYWLGRDLPSSQVVFVYASTICLSRLMLEVE